MTTIYGPMLYERDMHTLDEFDCGNLSVNRIIKEEIGFSDIYPEYGQFISVFSLEGVGHEQRKIIAFASGELITREGVNLRRCPPRIDIKVVAVDHEFQGLALSGAVTAHVMQTLFHHSGVQEMEMRMCEVASLRAHQLWERSGFTAVCNAEEKPPDMTRRINKNEVDWLVDRWQPRLRPGVIHAQSVAHFDVA